MFRDESTRVQKKYENPSIRDGDTGSDSEDPSSRTNKLPDDIHAPESHSSSITAVAISGKLWPLGGQAALDGPHAPMTQNLSDIAKAFFMTRYIPGSHFDYLPLVYNGASANSPLNSVVDAVAIASLSHGTQNPKLMALARQQYSQSLLQTKCALQDAWACRQDATLASVLLLAHFETLASEDPTGISDVALAHADIHNSPSASWNRHIQGAISLVALRPEPQIEFPVSVRLYQHVNATARYSCIQRRVRLPARAASWNLGGALKRDAADPARRFLAVVEDLTEIRARVKERSLTDPVEIVRLATSIDENAALVARSFPASWSYDVVTCSKNVKGVYKNKYHLYPNHSVAALWNEIRMARLALNEMMLVCFEDGWDGKESILESRRVRCLRVIEQMATEICQSSTQFLQSPASDSPSSSPFQPTIASAYFLVWPLFSASWASRVGAEGVSDFVIERLHFIAAEMKIPQAKKAALMVKQEVVHEDWLHMLHLF